MCVFHERLSVCVCACFLLVLRVECGQTALVPDYCFLIKVKTEKLRVRLIHVVKKSSLLQQLDKLSISQYK